MAANDPVRATPDRGNVYDATRQAMHEVSTDARFDIVDAKLEAIDLRFDAIVDKIDDLARQMDKRFEQVDRRFESLEARFFRLQVALVGGGLTAFVALVAT